MLFIKLTKQCPNDAHTVAVVRFQCWLWQRHKYDAPFMMHPYLAHRCSTQPKHGTVSRLRAVVRVHIPDRLAVPLAVPLACHGWGRRGYAQALPGCIGFIRYPCNLGLYLRLTQVGARCTSRGLALLPPTEEIKYGQRCQHASTCIGKVFHQAGLAFVGCPPVYTIGMHGRSHNNGN